MSPAQRRRDTTAASSQQRTEIRAIVAIPPIVGMPDDAVVGQLRKALDLVVEARERTPICQLDGHAWLSASAIGAMASQIVWLAGGDGGHRLAYGELPLDLVPVGNFRVRVPAGAEGAQPLLMAAEKLIEALLADLPAFRALQAAGCQSEVLRLARELAALTAGIPLGECKH